MSSSDRAVVSAVSSEGYVPVLRWRLAEQNALRDLTDDVKSLLRPLIEVTPSKMPLYDDEPRRKYIRSFLASLASSWSAAAFVDTHLLRPHFLIGAKSPVHEALLIAGSTGQAIVPVVPLPRKLGDPHLNIFTTPETRQHGLCIRMKPVDFVLSTDKIIRYFDNALTHFKVEPGEVDLVVDEEFTCEHAPTYDQMCTLIPRIREWRSFVVLSGNFPADLTEFGRGQIHLVRRNDWRRWQEQVRSKGLVRRPVFGDYTVQYAAYRPPLVDEIPRPSVSVRYTVDDKWLVCRGEALRDGGPGTEQWVGWAQLLTTMPDFKGETFSAGDRYIHARAKGDSTHGSFTTWISAGINHHLTLAARQASSSRAA